MSRGGAEATKNKKGNRGEWWRENQLSTPAPRDSSALRWFTHTNAQTPRTSNSPRPGHVMGLEEKKLERSCVSRKHATCMNSRGVHALIFQSPREPPYAADLPRTRLPANDYHISYDTEYAVLCHVPGMHVCVCLCHNNHPA